VNYYDELRDKKISLFICHPQKKEIHSHGFLELAYVLCGKAIHKWDNSTEEIKEGDYFVIDYSSKHSYESMSEDFSVINCLFCPELIDSSFTNCRSLSTLISSYKIRFNKDFFTASPSFNIYKDSDHKAREILLQMLSEFENQEPGFLQILRSKIVELLVITMRKIYLNPSLEKCDNGINSILTTINEQYMNELTLNDLSKKFGYSFSYLSAKFKKETGMNFTQYLQKTRIEQSMRLLSQTERPINLIAADVGYKDLKTYYSIFRRVANTTPAKFRKNHYNNT
jgi:AraC-like DNA-binding protein